MSMSEEEYVVKFKSFMAEHFEELKDNSEKKIMSHYQLVKASGMTGEELMLEIIHYANLDAINKSLALAFRVIWNVKNE